MLKIKLLVESRRLDDALGEIADAVVFAKKKRFNITLLDFYSCQARIYLLRRDFDRADNSLRTAEEIRATHRATPIQLSIYSRSKVDYLLCRLEDALRKDNPSSIAGYRRRCAAASRKFVKITRKAAQHRTEAFRLRGVYYGLINKPQKARKWLDKSIQEGRRLGARMELARTYSEMGRRIQQMPSAFTSPRDAEGDDYLERAKALFVEMDLQWDLEKLAHHAVH
jgi:hypothetical protein